MSALEKVLRLSAVPVEEDPGDELSLALTVALDELRLYLASSDSDDDGDDDSGGGDDGDEDDAGHMGHATYKALIKKGVKPAMAEKMCAKADQKVKASALLDSVYVMLSADDAPPEVSPTYLGRVVALAAPKGESASDRRSLAAKGWALEDGSYPMPDAKHVHSSAVLAASKHGDWKAAMRLIPKMARIHGVALSSLPGFGGEKVAATMLALAAKAMDDGGVPMHHGAFNGTHAHSHHLTAAHAHPHQHFGDNNHDGGPQHRQGSKPGQGRFGDY